MQVPEAQPSSGVASASAWLRARAMGLGREPQYAPHYLVGAALRKASRRSRWAEDRSHDLYVVEYPYYSYGLREACALAKALGQRGVTAIEFGVAGGNGLLALESHARYYEQRFDLRVDVIGFDCGSGLPRPVDFRDVPYEWFEGCFVMDEGILRQLLSKAELILGDVAESARAFSPSLPIGFVAFDMDYYSSTMAALRMFEGSYWSNWLPRIQAYFDDLGTIEMVGERRAIAEWNEQHSDRAIGHQYGTRERIFRAPAWAERMFQIHLFEHPDYATPVVDLGAQQLPVRLPGRQGRR